MEDSRENLVLHIKGLQQTLTERNTRIEQLQSEEWRTERHKAEVNAAYKRGWKDAAGTLMEDARQTARRLDNLRDVAFQTRLRGDRLAP